MSGRRAAIGQPDFQDCSAFSLSAVRVPGPSELAPAFSDEWGAGSVCAPPIPLRGASGCVGQALLPEPQAGSATVQRPPGSAPDCQP
jgi:hypothetical protein